MSAAWWYKREPLDNIELASRVTLEEFGAYTLLLDHLHHRGRPLPDVDRQIAGMLNIHPHKWRAIRSRLLALNLIVIEGECLDNPGATSVRLGRAARRLAGSRGGNASAISRKNSGLTRSKIQPDQDQDQDLEESAYALSENASSVPVLKVSGSLIDHAFRAYVALAEERQLPVPQSLSALRRKSLGTLLSQCGHEGWQQALDAVARSAFLCGNSGWRVTFDWLIKPANFTKAVEGQYDNRVRSGGKTADLAEALNRRLGNDE